MRSGDIPISEISRQIKSRMSVRDLAERLYPAHDFSKNPCDSPFKDQATGSLSIFANDQRFNDFSGDYKSDGGDCFDFYKKAKGISDGKIAFLELKEMVLGGGTVAPAPITRAPRAPEPPKERIRPALRTPSPEEVNQVGRLRSIDPEAVQIAVQRGLLHTCTSVQYGECFIVTDSSGRNDRVRRLDGQPIKPGVKAICTPGSQANWPIGIMEAQDFPAIALCEGEGDFLAAFGFLHSYRADVAPVCMGGASVSISPEAIELFRGKRCRIFVQSDPAGQKAWVRWRDQLRGVAAKITGFDFGGYYQTNEDVVTDLNDLLRVHPDCFTKHRDEIETLMQF